MSEESLDPDERRSAALLAQVASVPVALDENFVAALIRRVRMRRAIAKPLLAVGTLLAAIAGGIGIALRRGRR